MRKKEDFTISHKKQRCVNGDFHMAHFLLFRMCTHKCLANFNNLCVYLTVSLLFMADLDGIIFI